jgi:dihydroneopterin aldolase
MPDVVVLEDLRLDVIVGVLDHERTTPQPITISLEFERPFDAAAATDDLSLTTNYAAVLDVVEGIAIDGAFLLLETLVVRVARAVLDFDEAISAVTVSAKKLVPPVPQTIATVGVRTTVTRTSCD